MVIRLITIFLLVLTHRSLLAQDSLRNNRDSIPAGYDLLYEHGNCKLPGLVYLEVPGVPESRPLGTAQKRKKAVLVASGELSYQHFDRRGDSEDLLLINATSDIAVLSLNLLYKDMYPFRLAVRYNHSQPFQLDNQYEVNIGFDEKLFRRHLKEKLLNATRQDFLRKQSELKKQYEETFDQFQRQKQLLKSPVYLQRAMEERMKQAGAEMPAGGIPAFNRQFGQMDQWLSTLPGLPDLQKARQQVKDSLERKIGKGKLEALQKQIHTRLEQIRDSLEKKVKSFEDSLASRKQALAARLDSINKEIDEIRTTKDLKKYASAKGLKDSINSSRLTNVLMKTHVRVGKFLINHSELTVSNIFLFGGSIRYGDEKFVMLSAGFYDFAFRQVFNFRNDSLRRTRPSVMAIKVGKTDGDNLSAFSFYIGRKPKDGSAYGTLRTVAGIGAERKIYFGRNLVLDFEIAKSTTRPVSSAAKNEEALKDLLTRFSTKTIGMYGSLKIHLPRTRTRADLSYRYFGSQFESFNAARYFNPQNNVVAKLSQPFLKNRLYISTGIRYTDFRTYGIASNMKTRTLFASANATLRLKKIPIVSMGFYPGSQLYWLDQSRLYEYYYYILNATVSHHFRLGKTPVQAVLSWNRFYNKYSDSLISPAQSYYNIFLTAWRNNFSYTMNFSRQEMSQDDLNTVEAGLNYSTRVVKIGGSLKGNFTRHASKLGYTASGGIVIKKFGTINLIYDRSFLPERTGRIIPVATGQVQVIKPINFTLWQ